MFVISEKNKMKEMRQEVMDCDLQFIDAVIDENCLFFSSWCSNGLFRVERGKENAEYIADFQEIWPLFLHRQVFKIAERFYFIPYDGSKISVYDRKMDNIFYIEIAEVENLHISRAYVIQEDIYMVPRNFYTPFMILNTENHEYEIVEDFWDNISILFSHPEELCFDLYNSCMVDGKLYLCGIGSEGIVFVVDLKSWSVRCYQLSKPYRIHSFCFDKERFYFVLMDRCGVVCWDYKTDRESEYLIEDTGDLPIERPYMTIVRWREHLLLLPNQRDQIWEFDENEDIWKERKEYIPKGFYRTIKRWSLFAGYKVWNDRLFLFPRSGNGMIVLSEYDSVLYKIRCSAEYKSVIQEKWARHVNEQTVKREAMYENVITLKDLISALLYISSKKDKTVGEKIGKVVWDLCSCKTEKKGR